MPILAGLLQGLFGALAGFFGQWIAKKAAFAVAAVAVFSGLTVAFYAGLSLLLNVGVASLPSWQGMEWAVYMAVPNNLPGVIAAVLSADAAAALYRWNVENLKILSYVT